MGHRVVHSIQFSQRPVVPRESLWQLLPSMYHHYHVKELSLMYSFIVCVIGKASSNYYRLKKIRLKAAAHIFILYNITISNRVHLYYMWL